MGYWEKESKLPCPFWEKLFVWSSLKIGHYLLLLFYCNVIFNNERFWWIVKRDWKLLSKQNWPMGILCFLRKGKFPNGFEVVQRWQQGGGSRPWATIESLSSSILSKTKINNHKPLGWVFQSWVKFNPGKDYSSYKILLRFFLGKTC